MPLPTGDARPQRRLLRDNVFESVRDAIVDGTLEPGEALRDDELMRWLGVSRTPIRQALHKLVEIGLVEMTPGRHTRVAELDAALINQATYTTGILNEYAARKALGKMSDQQLTELKARLHAVELARAENDIPVLGPAISEFFLTFERAAGNAVLTETVEQLAPVLLRFLAPRDTLTNVDTIVDALHSINEAAQARDVALTVERIHALYEPTRQNFVDNIRPTLLADDREAPQR